MNDVLDHIVLAPGDKNLGAKHFVATVRLGFGPAAHRRQITAGLRFGQVHGTGPLAAYQVLKIRGLEFVRTGCQQRLNGTVGEQRAQGKTHVGRILHLATGRSNEFGQALTTKIDRVLQALPATLGELVESFLEPRCRSDLAVMPA